MKPYFEQDGITIFNGDSRSVLPSLQPKSVNCIVTSPPFFGLRDYGVEGQIGLEESADEYVDEIVGVMRSSRDALVEDGTLWLNLGDSYANDGKWGGHTGGKHVSALHCSPIGRNKRYTGLKPKDLIGIPWRVAFALQADGWYLRQAAPWVKRSAMPESVVDRPSCALETLFLLSKSERYFYDYQSARETCASGPSDLKKMREGRARLGGKAIGSEDLLCAASARTKVGTQRSVGNADGRNRRNSDWWYESIGMIVDDDGEIFGFDVTNSGYSGAHFATFPPKLIQPCILASCPSGGTVLDPFFGSGTTGWVCQDQHVKCIGIELNPEYCGLAANRLSQRMLFTGGGAA